MARNQYSCPACDKPLKSNTSRAIAAHNAICEKYQAQQAEDCKEAIQNSADALRQHIEKRKPIIPKLNQSTPASLSRSSNHQPSSPHPEPPQDHAPVTLNLEIELPEEAFMDLDPNETAPSASSPTGEVQEMTGRPRRTIRIPAHLEHYVPTDSKPVKMSQYASLFEQAAPPDSSDRSPIASEHSPSPPPTPTVTQTCPDSFGVYRIYKEWPLKHPESNTAVVRLGDAPTLLGSSSKSTPNFSGLDTDYDWFAPFENPTTFRVTKWYSDAKGPLSKQHLKDLIEVARQPDFDLTDFTEMKPDIDLHRLDDKNATDDHLFASYRWKKSSVKVSLPKDGEFWESEDDAPTFEVTGLRHRSLTEVITSAFEEPNACHYHTKGYTEMWKRPDAPDERLYSEIYTSPAYLEIEDEIRAAQTKLNNSLSEPESDTDSSASSQSSKSSDSSHSSKSSKSSDTSSKSSDSSCSSKSSNSSQSSHSLHSDEIPTVYPSLKRSSASKAAELVESVLETVVVPIIIYSDSTHLSSFGDVSLWPIYIYFGCLSKYFRSKPSFGAAHHFAYIPSLPNSIRQTYQTLFNSPISSELFTHLKRELMSAIWFLLLDEEFYEACRIGLVVLCADGVRRRLFPRLFMYCADYPEKVLMACLKNMGRCPCPRCLTRKDQIGQLGTKADMDRRQTQQRVYDHTIEYTINKAREKIFEFGKAVGSTVVEALLNPKSLIPTRNPFAEWFKEFGGNVYDMFVVDLMHEIELGVFKAIFTHIVRIAHKLGQEYVDEMNQRFSQCPTFGRDTIRRFSADTAAMKQMAARDFEDILQVAPSILAGLFPPQYDKIIQPLLFSFATFHAFAKMRLHSETTVNIFEYGSTRDLGFQLRYFKRDLCQKIEVQETPREANARYRREARQAEKSGNSTQNGPSKRRKTTKEFNLSTYKLHALGDYAQTIRRYGTLDNCTTQTGEQEHRRLKRYYSRTNKREFEDQVAAQATRDHRLHIISMRGENDRKQKHRMKNSDPDPLPPTDPSKHYHISDTERYPIDFNSFMDDYYDDLAVSDFVLKLYNHILLRLGRDKDPDSLDYTDRSTIRILRSRMYEHKVLRINYTTDDMRVDQDYINP